jgi:hypothetical protein
LAKLLGAKEESMHIDSDIEPPDLYNDEPPAPSEFEVPREPAPQAPAGGISETEARSLFSICRTHGEKYAVHGFQVFQSTMKEMGKPVVPGRGKMPDYMDHALAHISPAEVEDFKETVYRFDGN